MMPKLFVALCALGANAFLPKTPLSARPARAPARTAPRALLDVFVAGQLATAPIDASKLDLPSTVVISAKEKIQRERVALVQQAALKKEIEEQTKELVTGQSSPPAAAGGGDKDAKDKHKELKYPGIAKNIDFSYLNVGEGVYRTYLGINILGACISLGAWFLFTFDWCWFVDEGDEFEPAQKALLVADEPSEDDVEMVKPPNPPSEGQISSCVDAWVREPVAAEVRLLLKINKFLRVVQNQARSRELIEVWKKGNWACPWRLFGKAPLRVKLCVCARFGFSWCGPMEFGLRCAWSGK